MIKPILTSSNPKLPKTLTLRELLKANVTVHFEIMEPFGEMIKE
jgi:hypothetical protein